MVLNKIKYFLLFLLTGLLYSTFSHGQIPAESSSGHISREDFRKKQDSIKAHKIAPSVKLWNLRANGAYKERNYIDTNDMDRQILYPIFKKSIANSFTGNAGSAYQTAIFEKRETLQEFLFLQPYEWYLHRPETHNFIDTRTPYTELNYSTGGNNNKEENILDVLFTRNINKYWNVGMKYNLISSDGQYQNQKHKLYNFTLFSSYDAGRYKLWGYLGHNRIRLYENGGIEDDDLIDKETKVEARDMGIRLIEAKNSFHNYNYFLSHQYNIGEMRERVLFGDTIEVYPIKLVHTTHLDKSLREYSDKESTNSFYKEFNYAFGTEIIEKTTFQNLKSSIQVVLNEGYFNWFKYGLRAEIIHENVKYETPDLTPTFPEGANYTTSKYSSNNIAFEGGAFFSSTEKTTWAGSWRTYLSGERQGDTQAKAHYTRFIGKDSIQNHKLQLYFDLESKTPSFLWRHYFSNHIHWDNDFSKQTSLKIGGYYAQKQWKIEVGAYWQTIDNYTYFGFDALPRQADGKISVLTAYAKKNFSFWKLHFEPTIYFQQSSNEIELPLPQMVGYLNAYFDSYLFQKNLRLRIGADARYTTKWYAPAYAPSTGQFYLQKERELGESPKVDVYLVAKLKRASIFVKYEHLNQVFGNQGYFSALHYPITPSILKYGVRWYFYD